MKRKRTINKGAVFKHVLPPELFKPARLVRFTSIDETTVCLFDKEKNILLIDQALYDTLSPQDQTRVFRSRDSIVITHKGNSTRQQAAD